jgi:hypothetical protein
MTTSPQQQNATRQRERVAERVYAAIASMQSEIDAARRKGAPIKRLSRSAVLKRAGKVDKNTLKQPYHDALMKAVDAFLASNSIVAKKSNVKSMTETHDLGYYAQLLVAAQIVRDAAQAEARESKARIATLEEENRSLKTELSTVRHLGENVVSFKKAHRETTEG